MEEELDQTAAASDLYSLRNPYKEIIHVLYESVRECQSCQVLKQAHIEVQQECETYKESIETIKEDYKNKLDGNTEELKIKTIEFHNELNRQKDEYDRHVFQLKERYEKALIIREGTQYSISLLNQQLQRRQEYLEKLRKMLQKKENQLLNCRDQYLLNLKKTKNKQEVDLDGEYLKELQQLKADYEEGIKIREDQKETEIGLLKEELNDSMIERDYYIRKFKERLNEKDNNDKAVYEQQCNQIQNIILVLNNQHQKQIQFYLDQINQLEQQVLVAQSSISSSALSDLILKNGSSIFWKEGLELYTQSNVHDIESILKDIKEKELTHSQYLTKRFQTIFKTALVLNKYEKQFQFMRQLIEASPNQILKDQFLYYKQDKSALQKKNSVEFRTQKDLISSNDHSMKQFYSSLNDLNMIQQKNQQIVSEKMVHIFKLQQLNTEQSQQIKRLESQIKKQDRQKEELNSNIDRLQRRVIELQNHIKNENTQFTLMLQLKKIELEELISMNKKQIDSKNEDIARLCQDLEYFQNLLYQRPSRDEDLKVILNLKNDLQVKTERFNQLLLYIKSKEGEEPFKFSMNGDKVIIDNNLSKLLSKLHSDQSTLENSQISTMRRQADSSQRARTNSKGKQTSPVQNGQSNKIDIFLNSDFGDLSSILQHQKLYTRSTTPQQLQHSVLNRSRIETEPNLKSRNRCNTIQQDGSITPQIKPKRNYKTIEELTSTIIDNKINTEKQPSTKISSNQNNQELQEQQSAPWLIGLKKDIEKNFSDFVQNKSDIFIKKQEANLMRSQTPQTIRNRLISKQYNKQAQLLTHSIAQTNQQENSKANLTQNNDELTQFLNMSLSKSNPFIFKVGKKYNRSNTPISNTIRKE